MKVELQCRKFSFVKWVLIIAIIKFEFKNIPATHEGTIFQNIPATHEGTYFKCQKTISIIVKRENT